MQHPVWRAGAVSPLGVGLAGDMPNPRADANGLARWSWESDLLTVGVGAVNVVGRSVIVHRDPDDDISQHVGNSGPRLACGLIVAAG